MRERFRTSGAERLCALGGPVFFPIHALLTLGLAPACACALLLGRRSLARWWPLVAALCWFVGAGYLLSV